MGRGQDAAAGRVSGAPVFPTVADTRSWWIRTAWLARRPLWGSDEVTNLWITHWPRHADRGNVCLRPCSRLPSVEARRQPQAAGPRYVLGDLPEFSSRRRRPSGLSERSRSRPGQNGAVAWATPRLARSMPSFAPWRSRSPGLRTICRLEPCRRRSVEVSLPLTVRAPVVLHAGMAITANKVPGVRAAQASDPYSAERARESPTMPGSFYLFLRIRTQRVLGSDPSVGSTVPASIAPLRRLIGRTPCRG